MGLTKEQRLQKEITEKKAELHAIKARQFWKCPSCKRKTQVAFLSVELSLFYVPPSGCMEGDYYTPGKYPEYHVACPKCKKSIRIFTYQSDFREIKKNEKGWKQHQEWKFLHEHINYVYEVKKRIIE